MTTKSIIFVCSFHAWVKMYQNLDIWVWWRIMLLLVILMVVPKCKMKITGKFFIIWRILSIRANKYVPSSDCCIFSFNESINQFTTHTHTTTHADMPTCTNTPEEGHFPWSHSRKNRETSESKLKEALVVAVRRRIQYETIHKSKYCIGSHW